MKNLILLFALLLTGIITAQPARNNGPGSQRAKEKIEALAVAYITDQLSLSPQEAQQFWPVFNKLKDRRLAIEKEKRQLIKKVESQFESLSDQQALSHLKDLRMIEMRLKMASLETNADKIVDIIGAKRFFILLKAQQDFKRRMLKEFQKRRRGR